MLNRVSIYLLRPLNIGFSGLRFVETGRTFLKITVFKTGIVRFLLFLTKIEENEGLQWKMLLK
jgi:hypothetical protein